MLRAVWAHDFKIEIVDQGRQSGIVSCEPGRRIGPAQGRHDRRDAVPEKFPRQDILRGGDEAFLYPGLQGLLRVSPDLLCRGEPIDE
ncbi:MAG: hypothetical protein QE273_13095, partial [Verrucomicrobiales bacterium]|nr:hypothetical protein [Verrucomicrobiales bacterium]